MRTISETEVSQAIIRAYHEKLSACLTSDVIIVGAGPAGLVAAFRLASQGRSVTVLEKRLAVGGGIWGGGMGMNEAVIQDEALPLVDEFGVRHQPGYEGLHTVDTAELTCALCLKALQAGARVLNLTTVEDVGVRAGRVTGVVINRTMIVGALPVDPLTLAAKAVIDTTGHEAIVVAALRKRGLLPTPAAGAFGEGPMDATAGEAFVVERTSEIYPGLWVAGMSVCAALGGPRMGPIFGGMLLSGARAADLITPTIRET
ncbi:MAG: sulfide-dependent adenosine diphosphate thiazole synthase [Phycisphaerae bacterium]|jgi:thiamine thiazole synthase